MEERKKKDFNAFAFSLDCDRCQKLRSPKKLCYLSTKALNKNLKCTSI